MKSLHHPTELATGVALLMAGVASAQTVPANQEAAITKIEREVVVTAGRLEETLPQELARYGSRLTVVGSEQIANSGARDISQTLKVLAPGLYISSKNGPFDYVDVSLQGSRKTDILWLVDGVRINNRLYAGTTPLDTIPVHMVERIEILEGGQGLFYGTQAIAGVVNIVTRPFTDRPLGSFSVGIDEDMGQQLSGYVSDGHAGHQWVVYASNDKSDGHSSYRAADYQPSATDRERGYDVTTLGAKYAYDFSDTLRFSATYQHTDADLDFLRAFRNAYTVNARDEVLVSAKLDWQVSQAAGLYFKGYYHDWDTLYTRYYNSLTTPGAIDVLNQNAFWGYKDYGANALLKLSLHRGFEYHLGYDLQKYQARDEVWQIAQLTESTHAVFGQVRTTSELLQNASFAAGLRHTKPSEGPGSTIWNLSGQIELPRSFFVRGTLGTAFRLPSAEELFLIEPGEPQGNPNLKPERSTNINVSVGGRMELGQGGLTWELIGFARDVTDLISTDDFTFINVGDEVKVRGAELALTASFSSDWSAIGSVTLNRARSEGSDLQIVEIPERLFKAVLNYQPVKLPLGVTLTANHVGTVYDQVSGFGRIEHGGYTVLDLSARVFAGAQRQHRIQLSLENVLDKEYATSLTTATRDSGGAYPVWNLGMPRIWSASYAYGFGGR